MATDVHDLKGQILEGRYHVEHCLGAGGMGSVWKARDEKFEGGRAVVVKIPHPEILRRPGFRERFEREVRSLVKLELSGVVRVLDVGRIEETPFCVMQYLGGGALELQAARQGPAEVRRWLRPVARILDRIHHRGWVHRDVKPDNILFDADGEVHVADLGLAKAIGTEDSGVTLTGQTPGTPKYMAPECASPDPVGPHCDQYALGVMVYEAMAGCLPHEGTTAVELLSNRKVFPAAPLHEVAPSVSPAVSAVVGRALERDPRHRFASCTEFARAFAAAATTGEVAAPVGTADALRDDSRGLAGEPSAALRGSEDSTSALGAAPSSRPRSFRLSIALGKLKFSLTIACTLVVGFGAAAWYAGSLSHDDGGTPRSMTAAAPEGDASSGDAPGPPSDPAGDTTMKGEGDAKSEDGSRSLRLPDPSEDGDPETGADASTEVSEGEGISQEVQDKDLESGAVAGPVLPQPRLLMLDRLVETRPFEWRGPTRRPDRWSPLRGFLWLEPSSPAVLDRPELRLRGQLPSASVWLEVEGQPVRLDAEGRFEVVIPLQPGPREVVLVAEDGVGSRVVRRLRLEVGDDG